MTIVYEKDSFLSPNTSIRITSTTWLFQTSRASHEVDYISSNMQSAEPWWGSFACHLNSNHALVTVIPGESTCFSKFGILQIYIFTLQCCYALHTNSTNHWQVKVEYKPKIGPTLWHTASISYTSQLILAADWYVHPYNKAWWCIQLSDPTD